MTLLKNQDVFEHCKYPYILSSYRPNYSYLECIKSIFKLHNETMNCWTMIFISFVSLVYLFLNYDISTFYVTLSALIHLPFALSFHLFKCKEKHIAYRFEKLDHTFIFVSSIVLYHGLSYNTLPTLFYYINIYNILLISINGIRNIIFGAENRTGMEQRICIVYNVTLAVICYWFPMFYASLNGDVFIITYTLGVPLSLTAGAIVYLYGIPERFYPNTFDIYMNSHTLMHISLFIAHICELLFTSRINFLLHS